MAKQPKQLAELFHDTLKDIYYAEKKILTALRVTVRGMKEGPSRSAIRC